MDTQDNLPGKQQGPRFMQLIDRSVLTGVFGVTFALALLGYLGLDQFVYTRANDDLRSASMARYNAEIQHVVEAVAATIESTISGKIGPELGLDQREAVKRIIRGAKFEKSNTGLEVWNGYFFLYDMEGRCIAHGIDRDKEGELLLDLTDEDGLPLVKMLRDKSLHGGGFLKYKWRKPGRQTTSPKISYAKSLRGDQWWLGAGVYVDEIESVVTHAVDKQNNDKLIAVGALIGTLVTLMLITLSSGNILSRRISQPMVDRMQALARTANRERCYFAGVLHQMVGELIVGLKLKLTALAQPMDVATHQTLVTEASAYIDRFDGECQKLEHEIYPLVVQRHGAGTALKYWIEEVTEDLNSPEVDLAIDDSVVRSDTGRECALYLVVQGLFQNVLKHAEASKVRIALTYAAPNVTLTMTDNGKGFDVGAAMNQTSSGQSRFGLPGMLAQMEVYGGSLEIVSSFGQGTTVRITMPWPKQAETDNIP